MKSSSRNMIVLKSSDGVRFEIEEGVAAQLRTVNAMIEGDEMKKTIPLLHITSTVLGKVIEYCKKKLDDVDDDVESWNEEFVKLVDVPTLIDILFAAYYLENKSLLDLTCKAVADIINTN